MSRIGLRVQSMRSRYRGHQQVVADAERGRYYSQSAMREDVLAL